MSDDSDDTNGRECDKNDAYYKKYQLLMERCEFIQKSNERLVFRLQQVKTIIKRRYAQIDMLKERLNERYNEDWAEIPRDSAYYLLGEEGLDTKPPATLAISNTNANTLAASTAPIKVELKVEECSGDTSANRDTKPAAPIRKPVKRKSNREKDPNAPKRPSNPFFQYCQDQRQNLMEELAADLKPGECEPSKQELTRQLAIRWKSMSLNDKKMYVDMYERSKEKYAVELSEYKMKK